MFLYFIILHLISHLLLFISWKSTLNCQLRVILSTKEKEVTWVSTCVFVLFLFSSILFNDFHLTFFLVLSLALFTSIRCCRYVLFFLSFYVLFFRILNKHSLNSQHVSMTKILVFLDMGSWKLEVIRKWRDDLHTAVRWEFPLGMACYISFPLMAMFLFSRPEFFKDRVIADRKRFHPPPNPERVSWKYWTFVRIIVAVF